jgi:hypothetical protein
MTTSTEISRRENRRGCSPEGGGTSFIIWKPRRLCVCFRSGWIHRATADNNPARALPRISPGQMLRLVHGSTPFVILGTITPAPAARAVSMPSVELLL